MTLPWDTFEPKTAPLTNSEQPLRLPGDDGNVIIEPIVILGAGLAGCWLAHLLAVQGISVRLVDAHATVAAGASGNPAGIVKPHVTRTPCHAMDFHVAAHAYLLRQLESRPELRQPAFGDALFEATGVLQLVEKAYPVSPHYESVDAAGAQVIAGVSPNSSALHFHSSGWLNPGALCKALAGHPGITLSTGCRVAGISRIHLPTRHPHWRLSMPHGRDLLTSRLVLACGNALNTFAQTFSLPVIAARGQISRFRLKDHSTSPQCVINGKHYIIPEGKSVLAGATFDRGIDDDQVHQQDHVRNLAGLRETLPGLHVHDTALAGYAGVRATTPDRLPLSGPAPDAARIATVYADLKHGRTMENYPPLPCHDGLFVLGGFGSRGIVTAPFAAMILTELLTRTSRASWDQWATLVNPARFQIRDLKRGRMRPDSSVELD